MIVEPVPVAELPAALNLLLSGRTGFGGDPQELLEQHRCGEISFAGFFQARDEAQNMRLGCGLVLPQPGKTAFVWPPALIDDFQQHLAAPRTAVDVAVPLLNRMRERLADVGCTLGQCLLPPDWTEQRHWLETAGFSHLTDMHYLRRDLSQPPKESPADGGNPLDSSVVTYLAGENDALFADLLDASYVNTGDCPELNGLRDGGEALSGHRSTGAFDPALWTAYFADGTPVAVLLLTRHPELGDWELVYMGVAASARGRGWGHHLVNEALHKAHAGGASGLILAVDRRNHYAQTVYADAGFKPFCTQSIHLWRDVAKTSTVCARNRQSTGDDR